MILSKEQINRYLRHIIIPEISGAGQKKITESKVFLYAANAEEASSLVYYLSASGTGTISCFFEDISGSKKLFNNVRDLNGDVKIESADQAEENQGLPDAEGFKLRIILFSENINWNNMISCINNGNNSESIPTIIAYLCGWKGFIKTFESNDSLDTFLQSFQYMIRENAKEICEKDKGKLLSACFAGAVIATESIKLCLNLGTVSYRALCFDLLSMEFKTENDNESDIYQFMNKGSGIKKEKLFTSKELPDSRVLIVGTGGLGSPTAFALSCLGVGTLGLVDYDSVEISNLNRQILHSVSRIGMPKVESAREFIKALNPNVNIVTHHTGLNAVNAREIISSYDVVVDAVDNFSARYLLNDACYFENKPLVDAAAVKFNGLILTIIPDKCACYRCVFPDIPSASAGQSCRESGVLGPVPGVMGFLEAAEVIKLLTGTGSLLCNRILYYDALDAEFVNIKMSKSPNCQLCGEHPTVTELMEYQLACENK